MNLCVNARDAVTECLDGARKVPTAPGGFRIRVSAENVTIPEEYLRSFPYAREGDFVMVSVVDNGVGMDEETRRRVFEPFFTTKKMGRGTGLGLSTVFGIVKQHAGWINVESRRDEGSAFRVYIPRAGEPVRQTEAVPEQPGSHRGKETVLLADDEEMIRDLGRQVLEIHGYTVLSAADGQQAIDMFVRYRKRIDLVLLDLSMPRLSGMEVLERIRKLDPGARVILSSGYRSEDDEAAGKASRASAFLAKPYRADLLAKTVREVLDRDRPGHPPG
ncbi:MAG TPA: hypothetical protein DD658_08550 [Deltaproteobacteria bacterium]|nr:hypothetical protein [Deltaproteobacteria bacterium]